MKSTKSKNKPKSKKSKLQPAAKTKPRTKVLQELAQHFEADLNNVLPIAIQPDGSIVYEKYIIKPLTNSNWGLYNIQSRDLVEEFYLKTSAIMAAKAYTKTNLEKYFEIKRLDNRYWANYSDSLIFKKNMETVQEFDRYQILVTKLITSTEKTEHYKDKISKMFKGSFV
jgi:hypothetical protein